MMLPPTDRPGLTRRQLLGSAAAVAVAGWGARSSAAQSQQAVSASSSGPLAHLLPTASHDRFLIKASFTEPVVPTLRIGSRVFTGRATDREGRFFAFDAPDLEAATSYELRLADRRGRPLGEAWPLSTLPAPDSAPERVRLLVYTCAGGHDVMVRRDGERGFLPLATRQRLLRRALALAPDVVIANGDHIYWDQYSDSGGPGPGRSPAALAFAGEFDRSLPVLGSPNERVLKLSVGPQVADLYTTMLRSVPVFFLQDDHDYFDGDRASEEVVTFPPDPFMLRAARTGQWLYYPEFLPDRARPAGLASASMDDRPPGISESYGTLRWGRLLELLLYDCRRHQTLKGKVGSLVPREVEAWILARMASPDARHLVQVPSIPVGYTAGKWGEWYPDVLGEDRRLTTERPKGFWQEGWLRQHDRLLVGASAMRRLPLFLNGDLHSIAEATIERSGEHDLSKNPIRTALVGPVGTCAGWPSAGRGTRGTTSAVLGATADLECIEENGFMIADVLPEEITLSFFRWRPDDGRTGSGGEERIDALEPFRVTRLRA